MQYFPRWVAPNLMTFVGFLLTAANFVILSYYDWDFYAQTDDDSPAIPDWFWLIGAINIFLAYTLGDFFVVILLILLSLIHFLCTFQTELMASKHVELN